MMLSAPGQLQHSELAREILGSYCRRPKSNSCSNSVPQDLVVIIQAPIYEICTDDGQHLSLCKVPV